MALATLDDTLLSIPTVDLHLLSQSELHSLSLSSDKAQLNPRSCDEIPIPKIDRSVFNESAGSRKQTYSRLRLAPASSHTRYARKPPPSNDLDPLQNTQIVHLFKELFASQNNGNGQNLVSEASDMVKDVVVYENFEDIRGSLVVGVGSNGSKRKRGRPRKDESRVVPVPVGLVESGDDVRKAVVVYDNRKDVGSSGSKRRGRPRKDEILVGGDDVTKGVFSSGNVKGVVVDVMSSGKKRRGRPKKDKNLVVPVAVNVEVEDTGVGNKVGGVEVTKDVVVTENVEVKDRGIVNGVAGDDVTKDIPVSENDEVKDRGIVNEEVGGGDVTKGIVISENVEVKDRGILNEEVGGGDVTKGIAISENVDRDKKIVNMKGLVVDMGSSTGKRRRGRPRKGENVVVPVAGGDNVRRNIVVSDNVEVRDGIVADGIMAYSVAGDHLTTDITVSENAGARAMGQVGDDDVIKGTVVTENLDVRDMGIANSKGEIVDTVSSVGKKKRGRPRKDATLVVPVKAVGDGDVRNDILVDQNIEDRGRVITNGKGVVVDMVGSVGKMKTGRRKRDENSVIPVSVKPIGGDDVTKGIVAFENMENRDREIVNKNAEAVLDMGSNSSKKRRGRQRKDEFWVSPKAVKAAGGANVTNEIVASENVEDKDREIVNKNGVVVDPVALACLDDPYGPELNRRTAGLATKQELLAYLGGMKGQWGTRRMKRRIVEANDFGDVLPNGWKLLLSPKMQKGSVWLHCRRYISPSDRQFVSCKEVSAYLLSVSGFQSTNQPNYSHSNGGNKFAHTIVDIEFANSNEGINAPELAVVEDCEKENLACHSSAAMASVSGNHDKQVDSNLKIGDPVGVQVGENCGANANDELNPDSSHSKSKAVPDIDTCTDRFDHDLNFLPHDKQDLQANIDEENLAAQSCDKQNRDNITSNDKVGGVDEATNIVADTNLCLVSEAVLPNDEHSRDFETSCEANEQKCGVENNATGVSSGVEEQNQDAVFEIGLLTANGDDVRFTSMMDEFKLENYGNEVSTCTVEELGQQKYSESGFDFLSDYEQNYGAENYVDKISSRKLEDPKLDEVQRNIELSHPFGSSHSGLNAETSNSVYNVNKIYSMPGDEVRNSASHELSLAFGNPQEGLYSAANTGVGQQKYPPSCSVEQAFGVQNNLSRVNNSMVEDGKKSKGSVSDLFSLSFNGETCGFKDPVYPGGVWEEPKVDMVGNSGNNKFMLGFGSGHGQPDVDVLRGIWRTGEENAVQSGLANTASPLVQPSSSFCNFDMVSDKAEDGFFRLGEKYDSGPPAFQGLRQGRTEPVEFSFLTTQDSNSRQPDSNFLTTQDFDSSFWLGRDALMPSVGVSRSQVTTAVCVWCRNEFHQETAQSVTNSAIGFMCPTCHARISARR